MATYVPRVEQASFGSDRRERDNQGRRFLGNKFFVKRGGLWRLKRLKLDMQPQGNSSLKSPVRGKEVWKSNEVPRQQYISTYQSASTSGAPRPTVRKLMSVIQYGEQQGESDFGVVGR